MRKYLVWIAAGGFLASAAFLTGAWLISGGGGWNEFLLRASAARLPACGEALAGQSASRDIAWNAGDSVGVAIPATVRYSPGNGAGMKVSGDAALVSHIRVVDDGTVELDCRPGRLNNARLDITLPGRSFRSFAMAGLTHLILSDIDQPEIHMYLAGSSTVEAAGKVERIRVNAAGLSVAKLGALSAHDAKLFLAGASNVEVAADDSVTLNAAGATTVSLAKEPKTMETHIVGTGRVIHAAL